KSRSDFFERFLRPKIVFSDLEEHAIDEAERIVEHERFQFGVVRTAPKCSLEERKADDHFTPLGAVFVIARASDDPSRLSLDDGKSTLRFHRAIEEFLEYRARVALPIGVLLPDKRIARGFKESLEIVQAQGTQLDQLAGQNRLPIEFAIRFHSRTLNRRWSMGLPRTGLTVSRNCRVCAAAACPSNAFWLCQTSKTVKWFGRVAPCRTSRRTLPSSLRPSSTIRLRRAGTSRSRPPISTWVKTTIARSFAAAGAGPISNVLYGLWS